MFSASGLIAEQVDCFEFDENFNVNYYSFPVFEKIICSESNEKIIEFHSFELEKHSNQYWWVLIFVFCFSVVIWNLERAHILQLLKSIISLNYLNQLSRSDKGSEKLTGFIFSLFFVIVLSLSFQGVFKILFQTDISWYYIAAIFFGFVIYENFVHSTGGFLLKSNQLVTAQRLNKDALMFVGITVFLPLAFLMYFSTESAGVIASWLFLVFFVLITFVKEFRSLQLINSHRIKIVNFYFFIYLCTFKILPVLFMVKIFNRYLLNNL